MMTKTWIPVAMTVLLPALACGGPDEREDTTTVTVGVTFNPTNDPTVTSTASDSDDPGTMSGGTKLDVGSVDTGMLDDSGGCAEVSDTAMVGVQPADIIVVVDNSGSMSAEAGFVQQHMNTFSSQIFLANIDAHVVLISADDSDDAGICLAQPLGSGSCPNDTNLPGYLHIVDGVGSNAALQKIIQHHATWAPQMRPTAAKHIIVVSDDDSDMSASDFNNQFLALDPSHAGYKFHAIASPENEILACVQMTSCCLLAAALSQEYLDLVGLTGGVFGNLCEQNFGPIFDQVSMQVVQGASLACEYDIPPPPDGESFNPDEVNVEFDDGAGGILQIGRVDDPTQCAGVTDGWYYDVPAAPTKIVVCPQTCTKIQGFANASVSIKFGCATIPAG
ncbi:vWA domain-containing protein [Paraliomyxa miuraensis]|uniref:vWA domain-containing protein n=1 Tax=Paraliomyxa miuraensis TaxID=376150 RepID=UPI0022589685|nr:vWA domain-containing protein [Paraliomyxa miuraensis]MCX4247362.1 VWA domain-containing protein [Paraliomyxa miuraensis]